MLLSGAYYNSHRWIKQMTDKGTLDLVGMENRT